MGGPNSAADVIDPDATPQELATIANGEHASVNEAAESMVQHAIRAGEALRAAKAQLLHGQWLPWLRENFDGSERTAQGYMRLAANPQRVAHLANASLRQALEAVSGGRGSTNPAKSLQLRLDLAAHDRAQADSEWIKLVHGPWAADGSLPGRRRLPESPTVLAWRASLVDEPLREVELAAAAYGRTRDRVTAAVMNALMAGFREQACAERLDIPADDVHEFLERARR